MSFENTASVTQIKFRDMYKISESIFDCVQCMPSSLQRLAIFIIAG